MDEILIDPSNERTNLDLRQLGLNDVPVFGRYSYTTTHGPLELRSHGDLLEICYLESGQQTYLVEEEQFHVTGGDVFVVFPQELHGTGDLPQGRGVLFWLLIRIPAPGEPFLSLPPGEGRMIVDRLLALPRRFHGGNPIELALRRVFAAYDSVDNPLRVVNVRNLLVRLFLDVIEASEAGESNVTPLILKIQEFVTANLDQPLTIADLAEQSGLSNSHFNVRFKSEVGMPPIDYVMRKKVEESKVLLLRTDQTVTTVAMDLGFSTSQYFATVFKRYTGQTPSAFRNEFRALAGSRQLHGFHNTFISPKQ